MFWVYTWCINNRWSQLLSGRLRQMVPRWPPMLSSWFHHRKSHCNHPTASTHRHCRQLEMWNLGERINICNFDNDDYGNDDDDLYIIGAVCLSQKSLFPYSRDLVVSDVYSYIPYSKDLVVSMFLDTFVLKIIGRFHVSRHIPYSKNFVVFFCL